MSDVEIESGIGSAPDVASSVVGRPVPIVQPESQSYWEEARHHRLMIQHCQECRSWIHPPRAGCPVCLSFAVIGEEVSGFGKVFSFSVMHQRGIPGFDDALPLAVVLVELDEQEGLLAVGQILDAPVSGLRVGLRVHVDFEERPDGVILPQWRRAEQ